MQSRLEMQKASPAAVHAMLGLETFPPEIVQTGAFTPSNW